MQEALDESLSPEARRALFDQLDQDADAAAQFNRLRQVDQILKNAPFEHAPARLALAIMARLAELKAEHLPGTSGLALALALALVTLLALPLLMAAGWLVLAALGSAAALSAALQQIVMLLALVLGVLKVLVAGAQEWLASSPQSSALLALIPIALYGLLRSRGDADSGAV
jgi:ferric-dicitrate binding protein FerR (iron transport regulator)